ncbi:MAG: bifunctional (p)ppGpp synthetase/guanosine-3',5'-bis(diphosphate) 3'-pyrophosphohydrolase, partial [Acholeplasmataceae bacterium]|nr:bifunctional (p)ppGpp synthetase/guanosine-3',5'-bis(diphosphate) 3'-pyrophosphohydrolase [Acholeplasmataceae bacterium]
ATFCPNCKQFEDNRLIEAFWSNKITRKYPTWIKVVGGNKSTMLTDVVTAINASSVSIVEVNALTTNNLEMIIRIKISITNTQVLQQLMVNLRKISEIYSVERDFK